jgi:hypothetical protein
MKQYIIHYTYNDRKGLASYCTDSKEDAIKQFKEYHDGEVIEVEEVDLGGAV